MKFLYLLLYLVAKLLLNYRCPCSFLSPSLSTSPENTAILSAPLPFFLLHILSQSLSGLQNSLFVTNCHFSKLEVHPLPACLLIYDSI
uniref:Putative secreted protein n=1 Tax=Xenopsylla cheopis TaxID=163159 RepID=A0A6M2E012_XENCH